MNKIYFFLLLLFYAACSRPVAKFTYQGEERAPADIRFDNQSERAESYLWHFGDGDTSRGVNPTHRYRSSGLYTVRLEAVQGGKRRSAEQQLEVAPPEDCLVEISTNYGDMVVKLYDSTPQHQDNFLKLVEERFYDGLLFHRVIDGFMIQGGDPASRNARANTVLGRGGPGYTLPAEIVDSLIHLKGALAAARRGDKVNPEKRSSGSQFYLVQGRKLTEERLDEVAARKDIRYGAAQRKKYLEYGGTPVLDGEYTVFGRVIEGLDVIDKIAGLATDGRDRPREDVRMKIRIIR